MPRLIFTLGDLPKTYVYREVTAVRSDGFYRIARYGTDDLPFPFELVDRAKRPDSVSVLPVDEARREVWLVEQPRHTRALAVTPWGRAALDKAFANGRNAAGFRTRAKHVEVIETVAGMIDPGELAPLAAVRELQEEAGLEIGPEALELVQSYFPSGGGCTERVICYLAILPDPVAWSPPKGDAGEKMRVWAYSFEEAFALLDDGRLEGSATLILLQALRLREQARRIAELEARLPRDAG